MKVTSQRILEQVLRGLAQDLEQLQSLDEDFSALMQEAHQVSSRSFQGPPPAGWQEQWNELVQAHEEAQRHEAKARQLLSTQQGASPTAGAAEEWREVERLDQRLGELVETLRRDSRPADDAPHRQEWERCWESLEGYLGAMRAQTAAVTVKLELYRRHGGEEARRLTRAILSKVPAAKEARPESEVYQQAAEQLQREWHEVGGKWGIIRSLLMYQDTPEERVMSGGETNDPRAKNVRGAQ